MINYKDYEKSVYDWLMSKNNIDSTFTFSLRQNASKGAELDYFIGTEKSNYFSTTFWTIPVSYPGSSGDCIGLIFGYTKTGYKYFFEFDQTKSPEGSQNISVLNLHKSLREALFLSPGLERETSEKNKIYNLRTKTNKESYSSIEDMLSDVSIDIDYIIPLVNKYIETEKKRNPEFDAHRISEEEFEVMNKKYLKRLTNYNAENASHHKDSNDDLEIQNSKFQIALSKYNQEDLRTYFDFLRLILKKYDLKPNDKRLFFCVSKNNLNFTIGQRYCWNLFTSEPKGKFGVISKIELNQTSELFPGFQESAKAFFSNFSQFNPTDEQLSSIFEAIDLELKRSKSSSYTEKKNIEFEKFSFHNINKIYKNESVIPLNQILYGPPGTGKTYNTINKALNILEVDTNNMKREDIIKLFKLKVQEGQIVFTTFHQSFSYEDFIEGIKPVIDSNESTIDSDLKYIVENGVMKNLVDRIDNAQQFVESNQKQIYIDPIKFSKNINKISLGNSLDSKDDIIYEYCMKNDCIVIGFGEDIDFSGVKNRIEIRKRFQDNGIETSTSMDFNISAIERLVLWMELGQLVFVSDGMSKLKAIGEVSGDYYCDPSSPIRYAQFRKVKWLYKDLALPIEEIYGKKFSQQTIYQIDPKQINQSFFSTKNLKKKEADKYVLIIDEINRGNISSIFGELITLIEPDKRKGATEELSVILPYSKKPFSVPKNLYILGTMNTADRSVEALDTALRRRFSFEEMLPQPELLKDKGENGSGKVGNIVLEDLLITINERIEALVDRDHTIGHAFFMEVESLDSLRNVFANKVIPLLQEYFYGDYAKMEMVIGSDFFNIKDSSKIKFAVKPEDFETTGKTYQIKNLSDKTSMPDDMLLEAFDKLIRGVA